MREEFEALDCAIGVFRGLNEVHFRRELCRRAGPEEREDRRREFRQAVESLREVARAVEARYGRDYYYGVPGRDKSSVVAGIESFIEASEREVEKLE